MARSSFSRLPDPQSLTRCTVGSIRSLGMITELAPQEDRERWRDWLGRITWKKVEKADRIVILRLPAASTARFGEVEQQLMLRLGNAWSAYLLTGALTGVEDPWILLGETTDLHDGAALRSVDTAQELDRAQRPFHQGTRRWIEIEAAAFPPQPSRTARTSISTFEPRGIPATWMVERGGGAPPKRLP